MKAIMPVDLRIIRVRDFVELATRGSRDLASMKTALAEAASTYGAFSQYDLLVDTRGAETQLSVLDIWELAAYAAKVVHQGPPESFTAKIAVLCPLEDFDRAKFFELCAENRGLNIRAFTSFEDVFEWLHESLTHKDE